MMKFAMIDLNGMWLKDVKFDAHPMITVEENAEEIQVKDPMYVSDPVPNGLYHPKWVGKWIEGLTQAEIDVVMNEPKQLTEEQQRILDLEMIIADMMGV